MAPRDDEYDPARDTDSDNPFLALQRLAEAQVSATLQSLLGLPSAAIRPDHAFPDPYPRRERPAADPFAAGAHSPASPTASTPTPPHPPPAPPLRTLSALDLALYLHTSPYSPLALARDPALQRSGAPDWRLAFEDLLATRSGQSLGCPHLEADAQPPPPSSSSLLPPLQPSLQAPPSEREPWAARALRRWGDAWGAPDRARAWAAAPAALRARVPAAEQRAWDPEAYAGAGEPGCARPWGDVGRLVWEALRTASSGDEEETEEAGRGRAERAAEEAYGRLLGREDDDNDAHAPEARPAPAMGSWSEAAAVSRPAPPAAEAGTATGAATETEGERPSVVATMTMLRSVTLPDGTTRTKQVLKRRFANGRVEEDVREDVGRAGKDEGWAGSGTDPAPDGDPAKPALGSQEKALDLKKEGERKKGWFW